MLLAGAGAGLWLKAARLGRVERAAQELIWVRVDWLGPRAGAPAGKPVRAVPVHGPGGGRRRARRGAASLTAPGVARSRL